MNTVKLMLVCLIFSSTEAFAGIFEISAMYNYKKTKYDPVTYEESESGTASLAYYFWELSGLELSYTRGASILAQPPQYTIYQDLTGYGADFLFTIANRDSIFKPYIKAGGAYIIKSLRYYYTSTSNYAPVHVEGIAPNVGLGFKLMVGQQFAFKVGVDASTSPLSVTPVTNDFGVNGGISFLF